MGAGPARWRQSGLAVPHTMGRHPGLALPAARQPLLFVAGAAAVQLVIEDFTDEDGEIEQLQP